MKLALASMVVAIAAAAPAAAQTKYDGVWSVLVVTQRGACDVYRWQLLVSGGRIASPNMPVQAYGGVNRSGLVNVQFVSGADSLRARGRLSGASGQGRWEAPSRSCFGSWRAERVR